MDKRDKKLRKLYKKARQTFGKPLAQARVTKQIKSFIRSSQ